MHALDTRDTYGLITRSLHWATAAAIAVMLTIGWGAELLPKPAEELAMGLHISLGIGVLALGFARLGWWAVNRERPPHEPGLFGTVARLVQWSLMALLVIIPLSGWLLVSASGHTPGFFGLFHLPRLVPSGEELHELGEDVHETLPWVLLAVLGLHVLGALKHHYLDGAATLRRMLRAGTPAAARVRAAKKRPAQ